jgi:hypothetical protein
MHPFNNMLPIADCMLTAFVVFVLTTDSCCAAANDQGAWKQLIANAVRVNAVVVTSSDHANDNLCGLGHVTAPATKSVNSIEDSKVVDRIFTDFISMFVYS